MSNICLPLYFFPTLFTYAKYNVLPYLLFMGIMLDRIYYKLPFLNTILILSFYFIGRKMKPCRKKRMAIFRTCLYTSCYLGILFLLFQKFSIHLLFFQLIWNIIFTCCLFDSTRIYVKKD